ncbi:hypothetical protein WUBG_10685, partial [Wuchereria bancrofti]
RKTSVKRRIPFIIIYDTHTHTYIHTHTHTYIHGRQTEARTYIYILPYGYTEMGAKCLKYD